MYSILCAIHGLPPFFCGSEMLFPVLLDTSVLQDLLDDVETIDIRVS